MKVLLYSGGLDSWLIDKVWKPDKKIYIDMGTEYSEIEKSRLPSDVIIASFSLKQFELKNSIIPLRNLYLCLLACNLTGFEDVEICLGALNGDRVNDKSKKFAELLNPLLEYLYENQKSQPGRRAKLVMPFKDYSKRELLTEYVNNGGTLEEAFESTFSCYHPVHGKPCMSCKACFRKAIPFIVTGMKFNNSQKQKIINYMHEHVFTDMDNFLKDKGKEGVDCLSAIKVIQSWENKNHNGGIK